MFGGGRTCYGISVVHVVCMFGGGRTCYGISCVGVQALKCSKYYTHRGANMHIEVLGTPLCCLPLLMGIGLGHACIHPFQICSVSQ